MDPSRFDSLARATAGARSRRSFVEAAIAALAAAALGGRAEAAVKRVNGQVCAKNGDCRSNNCGPKDRTGRRYCECATACLMLDGSPGDCSSGYCTCDVCPSNYTCVENIEGRFACGIFFIGGNTCASEATCADPLDEISSPCLPPHQAFCIEDGQCASYIRYQDDRPLGAC
jgi:hypothetical protein